MARASSWRLDARDLVTAGALVALIGVLAGRGEPTPSAPTEPAAVTMPAALAPVIDVVPVAMPARTEVHGRVIDAGGRPVVGALVVATAVDRGGRRACDPLRDGVLTDRDGRFRFDDLPGGGYWFVAVHGAHPSGSTPVLPVVDRLDVTITLDLESLTV